MTVSGRIISAFSTFDRFQYHLKDAKVLLVKVGDQLLWSMQAVKHFFSPGKPIWWLWRNRLRPALLLLLIFQTELHILKLSNNLHPDYDVRPRNQFQVRYAECNFRNRDIDTAWKPIANMTVYSIRSYRKVFRDILPYSWLRLQLPIISF